MAWTTPKTWSTYETVTAAMLNTYIRDNQNFLAGNPTLLTSPLTSASFDGDSFSTTSKTLIDLSSEFSAPAGIRGVLINAKVKDSGSATNTTYIIISPNNTNNEGPLFLKIQGKPNDVQYASGAIWVPCDLNGDVYYQINASGSGTMDVVLEIWGYYQ